MITVKNLKKSFKNTSVLDGISFTVQTGEITGVLGPSGCGKTTLLRIIAGFDASDSGEIICDTNILEQNGQSKVPTRLRGLGFVFQDWSLIPHLSVEENIKLGLHKLPKEEADSRCNRLLDTMNLSAHSAHTPAELSGGQQQRVAIARSIALKPKLLLLDEPFSNLDRTFKTEFIVELKQLLKQENITALCVTHDHEDTFTFCDKAIVLCEGKVAQYDTPKTLYYKPKTIEVGDLMGFGFTYNNTYYRPEQIECVDKGTMKVTIQSIHFEGPTQRLELLDENNKTLWMRTLSTVTFTNGQVITISIRE